MKSVLSLFLVAMFSFFAAGHAAAVDVEVGVGMSMYKPVGNMMWYQEGFPYKLDVRDVGAQVGITGNAWQSGRFGIDWGASYVYLGRAKSDAVATPMDENYSPQEKSCIGECVAMSRFVGSGNVQGVALTLMPYVEHNGWKFGVLAGPFFYVARWDVTVYNWIPGPGHEPRTITAHYRPRLNVGALVGAQVSRGNWTLRYQRFFDRPSGDDTPGNFKVLWKHTDMLSVHYRF